MTASRKWSLLLVAFGAAVLVLPFVFPGNGRQTSGDTEARAPWSITVHADGTSGVFGLRLGASTLGEALTALGGGAEIALMLNRDRPAMLEAYLESATAGFVTGKMVLTASLPAEVTDAMQTRAVKVEALPSGARRLHLAADDRQRARDAKLDAVTFIPSVNLDATTVLQRFGAPGERILAQGGNEHFLYADKGLDLVLVADGKELLQYVAPRDFARLRAPLFASRGNADSGATGAVPQASPAGQ